MPISRTIQGFSLPAVLVLSTMISAVVLLLLFALKQRRIAVLELQNSVGRSHAISRFALLENGTDSYLLNNRQGTISKQVVSVGLNKYELYRATDGSGEFEKWYQVVKSIQIPLKTCLVLTDSMAGVIQFPSLRIIGSVSLRYPVWRIHDAESKPGEIYALRKEIISYSFPPLFHEKPEMVEGQPPAVWCNSADEIARISGKRVVQAISKGDVTIPAGNYEVQNWYLTGKRIRISNGTRISGFIWVLASESPVELTIERNVEITGVLCVDGSVIGDHWRVTGLLICRRFVSTKGRQLVVNRPENIVVTSGKNPVVNVHFPYFWNEGAEYKY